MKVEKAIIPADSLVFKYLPANYSDAYKSTFVPSVTFTPDDLQVAFWTSSPKWVSFLFRIRNSIVKLIGLEADKTNKEELEKCIRENKSYKIFSVVSKSQNETVLKLSDKHLDAYMSIFIANQDNNFQTLYSITVVHFHNRLGYVYFNIIRPFHAIVVKSMLKQILKSL